MKSKFAVVLAVTLSAFTVSVSAQNMVSLPEGAKPGECYARVVTPAQFKTVTERVLRKEASTSVRIVPATFDTVTERVLVKEGGEKIIIVDEQGNPYTGSRKPTIRTLSDGTIEVTPVDFETVTERVLVQEAYERMEAIPATYETVTERVLVAPARTEWKASSGRIYGNAVRDGSGAAVTKSDSGQLMCLVEIPAEYKTITKRVLKSPASNRKISVPAEYKTVTKRVPKKLFTKVVQTPPVYETITKQVVKEPAREVEVEVPAEYETITRREKVSDGDVVWMPVLCEVNVTNSNIIAIQRALAAKGHNPGPIDGKLGSSTMSAVGAFQRANGLAVGELTLQTVDKLGVVL